MDMAHFFDIVILRVFFLIAMLRFYCNVKGSLFHYIQNRIYCAKPDNVPYYIFTLVIGTSCKVIKICLEQNRV